jgi:hypothetical protein
MNSGLGKERNLNYAFRRASKMRMFIIVLLCGVLLGPVVSVAWAGVSSPLFDKPLREIHTPLPSDPYNPQFKPMLSCFYYPNFMVKQIDLGEKGAEQLSILPYWMKDNKEPPCLRANAKDEMVTDRKICDCYFEGVKNDFVFFRSVNDSEGGLGFAVFNSVNASSIFIDAAKLIKNSTEFTNLALLNHPENENESVLELRYRRVYRTPCSLRADERNCWSLVRHITGLTESSPPNCATAYDTEEKMSPENAKSWRTDPSVITYDVEVVLDSGNVVRLTPVSKAMECYPAE